MADLAHGAGVAGGSISYLEAAVLGVVQGLTEFLPISSTAHLRVVPALLHWPDLGVAFSAVIQLGSLVAVLAYFFQDLVRIAGGTIKALKNKDFSGPEVRLAGAIIIGTIPVVVLGLILKPFMEQLRSLYVIGGAAIFMGLFLLYAEKKAKHIKGIEQMGAKDGLIVGIGQAMALVPGCSRSGSTLTFAMLLGLKRADAARFSFLLGIPAIFASGMLELKEMLDAGLSGESMGALAVGLFTSLIVSYLSIAWLIKFLQNSNTYVFVGYRLLFGAITIFLAASKLIE